MFEIQREKSMLRKFLFSLIFLVSHTGVSSAQSCVDYDMYDAGKTYEDARLIVSYLADIQESDLYNSNGDRLTRAQQILRQDRANIHKSVSSTDQGSPDVFFQKAGNRAILEKAHYVTYCDADLAQIKNSVVQGQVPGLLEVMVFKMHDTGNYILFLNIVG